MTILYAEDDGDDRMLMEDALERTGPECDLQFVKDGEDAMDYLLKRGEYANRAALRPR